MVFVPKKGMLPQKNSNFGMEKQSVSNLLLLFMNKVMLVTIFFRFYYNWDILIFIL